MKAATRVYSQALVTIPSALILLLGCAASIVLLIRPMFGYYTPASVGYDFGNHIALVAGALETLRITHAVPISSNELIPGTEYPYFLFGNAGFYIIASLISLVLHAPPSFGAACTVALGFVVGQVGTYLLARSFGLNRVFSAVLGFLYATSPFVSVALLVRATLPEFLAWQVVPLLCFLGRRAMRPGASLLLLAALCGVLALPLYLHKLIGPHIMLFELVLLLVGVRRSWDWFARLVFVGVSVPAVSVFAWLPTLRVSGDRIVTFKAGSEGAIEVFNNSPINYFWPWAQDSLPATLHASFNEYDDRFALQIGLLASIGLMYAVWQLIRSGFRPRNRELVLAPIAVLVYSGLVLSVGDLIEKLPFPLNTIQFSLRLIGVASFAGLLALIAGLSEASARVENGHGWRAYLVPGVAALAVIASTATYWRQPRLLDQTLESIGPTSLIDYNAFYPRSFRSLFDTTGAIAPDGTLGARPWPMGLASGIERGVTGGTGLLPAESRQQWPRTIIIRGRVYDSQFGPANSSVVVRVYGLETAATEPCATEAELGKDLRDAITALMELCKSRGVDGPGSAIGLAGARVPRLLETRTLTEPGPIDLKISIPDKVFFVAIECAPPRSVTGPTSTAGSNCLHVDYLGPPNQLDGTVQIPRSLPSPALTRGPFGQWTIHLSGVAAGDYVLPTFDYSFVTITADDGSSVPSYEFDSRPVIRFDRTERTYKVGYDLRPEIEVFGVWVIATIGVFGIVTFARWWHTSLRRQPRKVHVTT